MSNPIPCRFWKHKKTGATVSIFSIPYVTEAGKADWEIVEKGWTVKHPDGTTGLARKPFDTEAEAQAWCDANPNFSGMNRP